MNDTKSAARWLLPFGVACCALYLVLFPPKPSPGKPAQSLQERIFRSLDWHGGTRLEYKMNPGDVLQKGLDTQAARRKALKQAQRVFLFRLRNFDLTENDVSPLGDDTIVVSVSETKGVEEAIHVTGVVSFREVGDGPFLEQDLSDADKAGLFQFKTDTAQGVVNVYYRLGPHGIGAEDIDYEETRVVRLQAGAQAGEPAVELRWRAASRQKAPDWLNKLYQKQIAICVDQDIHTIATVVAKDLDQAMITGFSSMTNAGALAKVLAGGYLPVSFDLQGRSLIGPRFGAVLQHRAIKVTAFAVAFILSLILLRCIDHMIMMIICVASIGLCAFCYFCLILSGAVALSAATLCAYVTLASMAVDNLILVFEQFRYQARGYGPWKKLGAAAAVDELVKAYNNERGIILVANISTALIIGSLYFAHGPIQDLVKATCLGLLVTWVTTVWYPRRLYISVPLVKFLEQFNLATRPVLKLSGNIFASGFQKFLLIVYLVALLASLACCFRQGFHVGLDLQGGKEIVVSSDEAVNVDALRRSAENYFGGRRCMVFRLSGAAGEDTGIRYAIRVPGGGILDVRQVAATGSKFVSIAPSTGDLAADQFVNSLKTALGVNGLRSESAQTIGGTELALDGTKLVACVGVAFILLAILIGSMYGGAAALYSIVAMITDGVIAFGAVSWFQVPLTVPVIAAVLTVIGFSLYDSILLCGHLVKGQESPNLVDVLAPLSARLVLISTATCGASIGLWVFGIEIMKDFGIVLTTGVVFGLMSSITIVAFGVMHSLRKPGVLGRSAL